MEWLWRIREWRPRLRTLLRLILILVVLLPLGSVVFLRLYENSLIQRTEAELTAQGSVIVAIYKMAIIDRFHSEDNKIDTITNYGMAVTNIPPANATEKSILSNLNIFHSTVQPPLPLATERLRSADALAYDIGGVLAPVVKEVEGATLAGIKILDYNGIIVSSTGNDLGLGWDGDAMEITHALEGKPTSVLRYRDKDSPFLLSYLLKTVGVRVYVTLPILVDDRVVGSVLLWRTPKNILQVLYDWRFPILLFAGTVATVVLLITLAFFYIIHRPAHTLAAQAQQMASSPGQSSGVPGHFHLASEYSQIADALRTMFGKLTYRSRYIHDFSSQMSQSFNPPLASIKEAIGHLQEHPSSKAKNQQLLQTITLESHYLERLIHRLQELAQAEIYTPSEESADLEKLLRSLAERYKQHGLDVTVTALPDVLIVPAGFDLLDKIFSTLLDNSEQFGSSTVDIIITPQENMVDILVRDNGQGIEEEAREKLFVPFYTTRRHVGATGLGLSIAHAYIEAHQGDIQLVPSESGTVFKVTLPCNSTKA